MELTKLAVETFASARQLQHKNFTFLIFYKWPNHDFLILAQKNNDSDIDTK